MKKIISQLITITPYIIVVIIIAYIIEELLEDFVSERVSDFVYPVAGLIVLGICWKYVIPVVQEYLASDKK